MKKVIIIFVFAISALQLSADQTATMQDGRLVILHDDDTWEYMGHDESLDLEDQIEITILEAKVVTPLFDEKQAGFRLKIKNNSAVPIYRLKIRIVFIDKNGKPFFEEERTPVSENSWLGSEVLKPNYSFLSPAKGLFHSVDTLDITEWDEGNIKIEIIEIKTEPRE